MTDTHDLGDVRISGNRLHASTPIKVMRGGNVTVTGCTFWHRCTACGHAWTGEVWDCPACGESNGPSTTPPLP